MFRGLIAILFGPLGLMLHDQISDDMALKRNLERSRKGYTGPRITGDEAERDEAIKQFLGRVQKQKPPAETSQSIPTIQPSQESSATASQTGKRTPEA
jgi:hypothetical protein